MPAAFKQFWDPSKKTVVITTEEIKEKIDAMIRCAKVAKSLGYDGVEVHALHWGYAMDQFTVPAMNDRTDEYGAQTWDSRLAIPRQVLDGIKAVCGQEFPVAMALGLQHFMAGYDMLDCDAGCYESYFYSNPPYYMPKCSVSPNVFLEASYALGIAEKKKNIAIVGGGIAGMAAAEFLTRRGHSVSIYE